MADLLIEFKPKQAFGARGMKMDLPDYVWLSRHRRCCRLPAGFPVDGKDWKPTRSPEPGDSLDPSPGRLTGGSAESTGTGGNALGPHATGRHELFDIVALAIGTLRCRITGA